MKSIFGFILLALVFSSCEIPGPGITPEYQQLVKVSGESFFLNDTTVIGYQDTLINQVENIWITFNELVQDSRCPTGVVCFWEGNAELSFRISVSGTPANLSLNSNPSFPTSAGFKSYLLELIDVIPYPQIGRLYTPNEFKARILISRLN